MKPSWVLLSEPRMVYIAQRSSSRLLQRVKVGHRGCVKTIPLRRNALNLVQLRHIYHELPARSFAIVE